MDDTPKSQEHIGEDNVPSRAIPILIGGTTVSSEEWAQKIVSSVWNTRATYEDHVRVTAEALNVLRQRIAELEYQLDQPERCPNPECRSTNRKVRGRLPGDPLDFSCHDYWCEHPWHSQAGQLPDEFSDSVERNKPLLERLAGQTHSTQALRERVSELERNIQRLEIGQDCDVCSGDLKGVKWRQCAKCAEQAERREAKLREALGEADEMMRDGFVCAADLQRWRARIDLANSKEPKNA